MIPSERPTPERVRDVIERLLREGSAVARSDGSRHTLFPVAIGAAEGEALRRWVTTEGATQTIEVGLGYGLSALFVCEGLILNAGSSGRHVVIDPYQTRRFSDCGLQFIEEAGVAGLVEHRGKESQIVLPQLPSEGRTFDLAFVDGNHRFDGVFVDLVYLGRLVRGGGIVFLDDYHLEAVARAAAFFVTNLGWTIEEVSTDDERHHWAALRTSSVSDTRSYDYFVDFWPLVTRSAGEQPPPTTPPSCRLSLMR